MHPSYDLRSSSGSRNPFTQVLTNQGAQQELFKTSSKSLDSAQRVDDATRNRPKRSRSLSHSRSRCSFSDHSDVSSMSADSQPTPPAQAGALSRASTSSGATEPLIGPTISKSTSSSQTTTFNRAAATNEPVSISLPPPPVAHPSLIWSYASATSNTPPRRSTPPPKKTNTTLQYALAQVKEDEREKEELKEENARLKAELDSKNPGSLRAWFGGSSKKEHELERYLREAKKQIEIYKAHAEREYRTATNLSRFVKQLEGALETERGRIKEIELEYQTSETNLKNAQESLSELREYVATNDVGDGQRVLTAFKDLNDAIDDISFQISETFSPGIREGTVPEPLIAHLKHCASQGDAMGLHLLERTKSQREDGRVVLDDIILPIVKLTINHHLFHTILHPFHPSLVEHPPTLDIFERIQSELQKNDTQARSARWRVTTINALEQCFACPSFAVDNSSDLVLKLIVLILTLFPFEPNNKTDMSPFTTAIGTLVESAIAFTKLHRVKYLSCNFEILFPKVGDKFHKTKMEEKSDAKGKGSLSGQRVVVFTSTFGLMQSKMVENKKGEKKIEKIMLIKAEVITEKQSVSDL